MHRFNRFYLLFSLVLSFAIPFITIEVAVESLPKPLVFQSAPAPTSVSVSVPVLAPTPATILTPPQDQAIASKVATVQETETNYLPIVFGVYTHWLRHFWSSDLEKNIYSLILKAKKKPKGCLQLFHIGLIQRRTVATYVLKIHFHKRR